MARTVISEEAPKPMGPYSQALAAGEFVFVSGQLGIDPATSRLVEGGAKAQARRCLENISAILQAEGLVMQDVVKTTVFVTDLASFKDVNQAYASFFPASPPARSTVEVSALPMGASVEIEAVAFRRRSALHP